MREVLEGAAARLAAQHASPTEIGAMAELIAQEPALFQEARALAETNQRLHGLLYLAAHNRYLLRSLEQLGATMALLPSLLTVGGRAAQAQLQRQAPGGLRLDAVHARLQRVARRSCERGA